MKPERHRRARWAMVLRPGAAGLATAYALWHEAAPVETARAAEVPDHLLNGLEVIDDRLRALIRDERKGDGLEPKRLHARIREIYDLEAKAIAPPPHASLYGAQLSY